MAVCIKLLSSESGVIVTAGVSIMRSNGIHILESLKLDELAMKRVNEFAFILQPLKLKGAAGSTVAPMAIR